MIDGASTNPAARARFARRLWGLPAVFALFFVVIALWAMATPQFASPDEPSHVYRAYGVVHGQVWVAPKAAMNGSGGYVDVPVGLTKSANSTGCYAFRPDKPANCLHRASGSKRLVSAATGAARYNPAYYFVVGSPSLFVSNGHMVIAMRLVSAALSALMLAWAVTSVALLRRPRVAVATAVFAITPMTLFLGGSVNPNGLEISAAAALWAGLLVLLTGHDPRHTVMLVRRSVIAASALVLMRSLSPLWLLLIVLVCAITLRRASLRRLATRRIAAWVGVVVAAGVTAVLWTVRSGALVISQLHRPLHYPFWHRFNLAWDHQLNDWRSEIGIFGWLDTRMPAWTYFAWISLGGAFLLLALMVGRWRARLQLLACFAVTLLVPVLIEAVAWNSDGPVWQGRYTLPLAIGIVVAMAVTLGDAPRLPPVPAWASTAALAVASVACNVFAFVWALYRYSVGTSASFSITGRWQPPLGSWTLTALQLAAGGIAVAAVLAFRRGATAGSAPALVSNKDPAAIEEEVADGDQHGGHQLGREVVESKIREAGDDEHRQT